MKKMKMENGKLKNVLKKTISIFALTSLLFGQVLVSCSDTVSEETVTGETQNTDSSTTEPTVDNQNQVDGEENKVSAGSYTFTTPDETHTFSLAGTALEGKTVTWTTENPYIVNFLDSNGKLVALSGGKTTVTATADGTSVSFDAEVS